MSSFIPPPYLPLIIILVGVNVSLAIFCLYKIIKNIDLSKGKKIGWGFVVFCFCFIGPIAYIISSRQRQVLE
ncbi:MAG: PLDc N-terminal domain-containing protein [Promethearchaeota archaeon]